MRIGVFGVGFGVKGLGFRSLGFRGLGRRIDLPSGMCFRAYLDPLQPT